MFENMPEYLCTQLTLMWNIGVLSNIVGEFLEVCRKFGHKNVDLDYEDYIYRAHIKCLMTCKIAQAQEWNYFQMDNSDT